MDSIDGYAISRNTSRNCLSDRLPKNWYLAICLFAITLPGCVSYHPAPLSSSKALSNFEARSLDNPGLRDFVVQNGEKIAQWPPQTWSLSLLTLAAWYYNPDLDVARAQWGVAKAGVITAGMIPNPVAGLSIQHDMDAASGISPWTLGWDLDIPLETAGKRGYRINQSKQLAQAARLELYGTAWHVRSRLKTALSNLYGARENLNLLKEQQSILARTVALLEQRLAVGSVSLPDVTRARISLERNRMDLQEARKKYDEERVQLAAAIGLPSTALNGIRISFDELLATPDPKNLPSTETRREALLNRTDVLAALAEYNASQSALQLEIARQYPDVHLGPGYTWDQGERKWSAGLSFQLPIFNHNEGPIAEAEARCKQSAAKFNALQAHVINKVELAGNAYQASMDQLATAEKLFSARQKYQSSIQAKADVGESGQLALNESRLELMNAKRSLLDARIKVMQSLGLLEDSLQRPLAPDNPISPLVEQNPRKEVGQQ